AITPEKKLLRQPLDIVDRVGEVGIRPNRPAAVVGVSRPESPAYRAGLRTFDLVTDVRGRPVKTFAELEAILRDNHGENVPVTYLRPVSVPKALGGLGPIAVYEWGLAALTPEARATGPASEGPHGDLVARTGIEPADLYVSYVPEGS